MPPAKPERNRALRQRRAAAASLRALAHEFHIHHTTVVEILASTGGDPLRLVELEHETEHQLNRRRIRLVERIGADLRALLVIDEELDVRRLDKLLGLTKKKG